MGYPHREPGSKKPYTELYLMCQPVDSNLPAEHQELNRADVLEFLRQNKQKERYVPEWIETSNSERLSKLTDILKAWMEQKAPQVAVSSIKNKLKNKIISRSSKETAPQLVEEKFQLQNFDLIVWEYVTKE